MQPLKMQGCYGNKSKWNAGKVMEKGFRESVIHRDKEDDDPPAGKR